MGHKARIKTKSRVILRHGEGHISKEFLSLFAFYYSTTYPQTVAHFEAETTNHRTGIDDLCGTCLTAFQCFDGNFVNFDGKSHPAHSEQDDFCGALHATTVTQPAAAHLRLAGLETQQPCVCRVADSGQPSTAPCESVHAVVRGTHLGQRLGF
jgi:hypothetical protein